MRFLSDDVAWQSAYKRRGLTPPEPPANPLPARVRATRAHGSPRAIVRRRCKTTG